MNGPHVLTTAHDKPSQGPITVSQVMGFPAIQHAMANMHHWTPAIKAGVASILSNRTSFIRNSANPAENQQFDLLLEEVENCIDNDAQVGIKFAELMDPSYVIVDFDGAAAPDGYRGWLDQINAHLGGAAVGAAGPGNFNVNVGGNQPISLMDPNLNNLNLLHVNTRHNADHVAGQLLILGGLSSWVLESKIAPSYR
eukprot:gene27025-32656_t